MNHLPRDYVKSYDLVIFAFQAVGFRLYDKASAWERILNKIHFIGVFLLIVMYGLSHMSNLVIRDDNMDFINLASVLPVSLVIGQELIKAYFLVIRKGIIREIIEELGDLWPEDIFDDKQKADLMYGNLRRLRIFSSGFLIFGVFALVVFILVPVLITLWHLNDPDYGFIGPFEMHYPFQVDSLPKYLVTCVFQAIAVPLYLGYIIPGLLLILTLVVNITNLLHIVRIDLENAIIPEKNLRKDSTGKLKYVVSQETREKNINNLADIVKTHQRLLRLVEKMNSAFGAAIFMSVASSSLIICCFAFLTIIAKGLRLIRHVTGVISNVITIFSYSWPGHLVYETSRGVALSAYNSKWYEGDAKVRKYILYIIMRSNKPSYLSALGYYRMSLESFTVALSGAFSYLSLMRQVYQRMGEEES